MALQDAFELTDALYRDRAMAETWGYPKAGARYPIKLLLTLTDDGLYTTIRTEYPDDCANPFFFEDMNTFLTTLNLEGGQVYWWEGSYTKLKNGKPRFVGKLTRVEI